MKDLIILIDEFIGGKVTFDLFYSKFNDLYCIEPSIFKENEEEFVSSINDKLGYSGGNPNIEERSYGLISSEEFKKWLESYKINNINFWNNKE
ncbi:MAG: hypothetical protein A2908_02180 [Candidatus Staskawiczbacteria bacterium RIFCSPLOWO2_01_FULL_38_12b]|uniref:Uncharacterized protein n=1 Tax=Candidatus Staskawiczbacteria bacterium RIFCSPLOWO2_01_FULL_38_12b TaxID=1802214 RepID=A0A1G2IFJ2_9BACT|nr:MAG: hypothetical protein A2908_02180 [Candidatus Staskawiczbacteria bacterium RIFCSPLOWO2_01_FULL_38_12b]